MDRNCTTAPIAKAQTLPGNFLRQGYLVADPRFAADKARLAALLPKTDAPEIEAASAADREADINRRQDEAFKRDR